MIAGTLVTIPQRAICYKSCSGQEYLIDITLSLAGDEVAVDTVDAGPCPLAVGCVRELLHLRLRGHAPYTSPQHRGGIVLRGADVVAVAKVLGAPPVVAATVGLLGLRLTPCKVIATVLRTVGTDVLRCPLCTTGQS